MQTAGRRPTSPGQAVRQAMEQQLVACVQDSLALYLYENARFMAERLLAEFHSEACPSSQSIQCRVCAQVLLRTSCMSSMLQ